jgi:MSHA biogenesis protein MshP
MDSVQPVSVFKIASGGGKYQRGISLVAAVFIIVVLAILGLMMVTIGGMERATAVAAAQGARAYYAARAGIEWGTYQAMPPTNSCVAISPLPLGPPTPPTFSLTVSGLSGYNVWVDCTSTQHRERNDTYNVYVITSTAKFSDFGTADYVSRTLQVSVTTAQP